MGLTSCSADACGRSSYVSIMDGLKHHGRNQSYPFLISRCRVRVHVPIISGSRTHFLTQFLTSFTFHLIFFTLSYIELSVEVSCVVNLHSVFEAITIRINQCRIQIKSTSPNLVQIAIRSSMRINLNEEIVQAKVLSQITTRHSQTKLLLKVEATQDVQT